MKKQMMAHVRSMGGECHYSGQWPATLFIHAGHNKQRIIDALYKRFTRHTPIRIL